MRAIFFLGKRAKSTQSTVFEILYVFMNETIICKNKISLEEGLIHIFCCFYNRYYVISVSRTKPFLDFPFGRNFVSKN